MDTNSSQAADPNAIKNDSHLSDVERSFLASASYPVTDITPVTGNTGSWNIVGKPRELGNGLEIYALKQEGSSEVVFTVRGSDFEPDGNSDWGLDGANLAFSGTCHPQVEAALSYVYEFVHKAEHERSDFTYSTTGHSKGGGISQIIAHTFGLQGTALDPAPGGAVIESQGYKDLMVELGITPPGIPENGFTNYVEKGSLVGDYLENLTVKTPANFHDLIERYTSLAVDEDGVVRVGSHLGDTVRVDLEPGSVLTHLNVLAQHERFDDVISLAAQGPVGLLGDQIKERISTLQNTEQIKLELEQALPNEGYQAKIIEGFIGSLDREISALKQEIADLQNVKIDKIEEEYGLVDNWMRDSDFTPQHIDTKTLENLESVYSKAVEDVLNANLYLNNQEIGVLLDKRDSMKDMLAEREVNLAEGNLPFLKNEIAVLENEIADIQGQQRELLRQKVGGELDSWMEDGEFLDNLFKNNPQLSNMSLSQVEKFRDPSTMENLLDHLGTINSHLSQVNTNPAPSSAPPYLHQPPIYTIQPGDTLSEIAEANNTTVENLLYFNLEISDPDDIQVGDELNIPPEGWELPPLEAMTDADGNPILLASTDPDMAERILAARQETEADAEESEQQQPPKGDLNKEFLNLMSSESDLRDAINTGNGWDIARTGAGFVSGLDDYADALPGGGDGFLSESNGSEAIVDGIEHGIGFGQAVDEGDGWGIAGNSIDLLRDIESYMDANGGGFLDAEGVGSGATALNIASAGFALADAIEDGDGWGIASSSTELIRGIDQYSDSINLGENTMSGIGSAIGLAANIASFDDVLESGDAVRIAYQTVSTVNNAIMTYNAIAGVVDGLGVISGGLGSVGSLLGTTGSIAGSIPVMSILAIGAQLAMGDVRGAAVTAATTVLMACGPWGWAAAAVLQIANMLMTDDPPSATADFALDENGNVIMDVHGDSDMKDSVQAAASPLVAIIQNYKKLGGRVTIDGSLPSLRIEAGKDPEIRYTSEYGGKVVISVADRSRLGLDMRGALYARDRGDRVDDAIKLARDSSGNIDFAKVDASLAAMGFVKRGMTYTYGESWTPRVGVTYGNGVFTGGGNANGPQGQHFVATSGDIKSLPLTPDQRPSQTIGKLLSAVSLQHNFAGASGLLLAMGLGLDVDQACAAAFYGQTEHPETNTDYVKPLDAAALESYLTNGHGPTEQQGAQPTDSNSIPPITDEADLQAILTSQLPGLGSTFDPFADQSGVSGFSFAKAAALPATSYSNIPEWWQELSASDLYEYFYPDQKPVDALPTNNILISETDLPSGFEAPPLPEGTSQGVYFSMVQDSSLRFLASSLVQETSYSSSAESYTLLSYGNAQHGTLYEDANGDLRFAADEGFAGTASFEYTLLGPDGETITRRALIVVEDQNDLPELNPDHFIINEGESFYLDQLLNNDSDADGDSIILDHFRGLEHGTISEVNNRLLFTPEEGFTGTLNFSYMAHDGTYPQRGTASLTILDQNLGPVPTDDRFIILEDHSLTTTADKLLANDHEYDGETIQLTGVHGARHGQVSMDASSTVTFIPDADYAGTEAGFSYTVTDQSDNLSTGFAAIEVLDQREAPQVSSTTYPAINEDEPITFCPEEIAKFVSDADGDQLHLDFITNIEHGSVTVENGFFKFIPEAGYSGIASFDYQANDSHRGTVQGHLEFEILPVNDPVAMGADSLQTTEETPLLIAVGDLLANDSDPEGGVVNFVSVGDAAHGTVSVDGSGDIRFTPNSNYFGAEAGFNYTVKDDEGLESTAFVKVEVLNSNDAPESITDTLSTNEDQAITFDASTIERFLRDVDGDNITLTGIVNVNGGVVSEENGVYTFTPHADYHGAASLDYSASDGNGGTVSGSLQIDILSVDDATVFGAAILTTDEEVSVTTTVTALLANDSDVEGPLSLCFQPAAISNLPLY